MTDQTDTNHSTLPGVVDLAAELDLADLFGKGLQTVCALIGTAAQALLEHEQDQQARLAGLEAKVKDQEGEILTFLEELEEARVLLRDLMPVRAALPEALAQRIESVFAALDGKAS